jgi:hypothetical protein
MFLEQAAARPQRCYYRQTGDNSCALLQVAVAVGQAKDSAALLAAAARAGYSYVLSIHAAVLGVFNCKGTLRQL